MTRVVEVVEGLGDVKQEGRESAGDVVFIFLESQELAVIDDNVEFENRIAVVLVLVLEVQWLVD